MKKEFLDLGKQPIANKFLNKGEFNNEFLFDLKAVFDDETKLVSLKEFVAPEMMFNDEYAYHASMSDTMKTHFKSLSDRLQSEFNPVNVLEIGSNDGIFIRHFNPDTTIAVEPCGNFADMTNDMEYKTYPEFWTTKLSTLIKQEHGTMDLIYAANCICHIHDLDDTFTAVRNLLSEDGIFVFEDPSLLRMMERGSYDQLYDEHAHIFSVTALGNLLEKNGLEIFRVDNLSVHGGSNRIYAGLKSKRITELSVSTNLMDENNFGLDRFETYEVFSDRVKKSKKDLVSMLKSLKLEGKKVIAYGAASKATTVFNYCGIDKSLIAYITDTTPSKVGKYQPGTHIPIISPEEGFGDTVDVAYLGAWNFRTEIMNKEISYLSNGGKFITHVPEVMIFS
jgi:methylation protein EvaC|tara:strand:- start:11202 stop:12380 length:1179 start_codon:yes stop_codon:yes gene_type:complete